MTDDPVPDDPDPAAPPDARVPGEAGVWAAACAVAAAAGLAPGVLLAGWIAGLMNRDGWRSVSSRASVGGAAVWVPLAGLTAYAGWLGWRSRGRIAAARGPARAAWRWLAAGAAVFLAAAVWVVTGSRGEQGPAVFVLLLGGPAVGAGLLAWAAAACGPPAYRRPLAQTAGWVGGCVLAGLLTFGPPVWQTVRGAALVPGTPPELLAGGGVLVVLAATLTAAVVWRADPDAHDALARWGQVGAAGFAAAGALLAPLLARFFGETTGDNRGQAWFFTAFVVLPALGCGAAALAGRWAGRQVPPRID